MNEANPSEPVFIRKLIKIILSNLEKENFGVNELARAAGTTSSSLRRRLHAVSKKSINQLIREVRLRKAMEIIRQEEVTASEVAYKVGFGSPAYFNKCFHEYFGYPPGEVRKRENGDLAESNRIIVNNTVDEAEKPVSKKSFRKIILYSASGILILFIIYLVFNNLSLESFSILLGDRIKSEDKSIAVLPFKSLSEDEGNQYFADGVTGNILYNLIQISEIKVINSPINKLEENTTNFNRIANKLKVRFFLTGSVQKSGDQVMVLAQLTDVSKNQIIWSETYTRDLTDIFRIQSDIAQQVAINLQTVIKKGEKEQIEKIPTKNMKAHAYYVMGRYLLDKRALRTDDLGKYMKPFEKAIAEDPEYAEAYVGLADAYLTLTRFQSYPRPEGFIKAKVNVLKALELDNNLAEAHATLGAILCWYEWKWEEARKEFELAIGLNPNYELAHKNYASLMCILRQMELSRYHRLRAAELNPVSPYLILWKASLLEEEGKLVETIEEYNKFIELYPDIYSVYWRLWGFYNRQGEELKAVESLQQAFQFHPENRPYIDTIKVVYNKQGIKGLEKWLNEYTIKHDDKGGWRGIVRYYNRIGEKEKALEWLEKAYEWKIPNLPEINSMSSLENLRSEPRFQALLDSMGLTPYQ